MSKTGIFLSSVVYLSMGAVTLFSLSSCSNTRKVAKVIPVESSAQSAQAAAIQSGPFLIDKVASKTAQTRSPASTEE